MKIDKDVPFPNAMRPSNRYPLQDMAVGDSFFVEGKRSSDMMGSISWATKVTGWKYTSRTTSGGVRVWRVE